jgi:2-oxoglutarate dehydrogenase E1 component
MLSEAAVLGFEYGYSRDYPEALVLWEAQFGDFANNAQGIIDQFIAAGEDKWGLLSGVVLLLPHGYEGQGPEHSSARIERFLQLAGEDNIQVCQPSSAAQYFHLLRRQALRKWRKPLVVFTPKSMLRHPDAVSPIEELTRPRFLTVAPDREIENAARVLICTGKVGHELRAERKRRADTSTAIFFLDQLYPFPGADLKAALAAHPNAREVVWVQEEPANMGALSHVLPQLELTAGCPVRSVKRSASASPATGSAKAHELEQKTLLTLAFGT